MTIICDYFPYSVLSPSSFSLKRISGSCLRCSFLRGGFPLGLSIESLDDLILKVFAILFQHKSILNRTSGINITMPQLSKSWLQITSASVLEILLD